MSVLYRPFSSTLLFTRQFSSSVLRRTRKRKLQGTQGMPEERLHALVSLYHQSSTWVTPENLDDYIDRVFTPEKTKINSSYGKTHLFIERRKEDMEFILQDRRLTPKYGGPDEQLIVDHRSIINLPIDQQSIVGKNAAEVHAALWGNDVSTKPGVQSVRDALDEDNSRNAKS